MKKVTTNDDITYQVPGTWYQIYQVQSAIQDPSHQPVRAAGARDVPQPKRYLWCMSTYNTRTAASPSAHSQRMNE